MLPVLRVEALEVVIEVAEVSRSRAWRVFWALLLLRILVIPAEAHGAQSHCAQKGPWFDGVQYFPGNGDYSVRGAKADIEIKTGDLCSSEGTTESATWSMVNDSGLQGWAQIGYLNRSASPTLVYFWQWMKDTNPPPGQEVKTATGLFGNPQVDAQRVFRVERLGSDGKLHMYLGGDEAPCNSQGDCAVTPFDPLNVWDGTAAEWYGETSWGGSDVPGTTNDRTDFESVRVKFPGNDWDFSNWTAQGSDKCFYKQAVVTQDQHFRIWTQPLDHDC